MLRSAMASAIVIGWSWVREDRSWQNVTNSDSAPLLAVEDHRNFVIGAIELGLFEHRRFASALRPAVNLDPVLTEIHNPVVADADRGVSSPLNSSVRRI